MSTTGGVSRERGYTALIVLLLIAIGFAALDFFLLNQKNGEDRQAIALTTQIQVLSQQTAKFALESADGNTDSFKELESTRNAIDSAVQRLDKGDPKSGMQPYSDNNATPAGRAVSALDASWKQLDADIGKILSNKAVVLDSGQRASTLSQQMPLLNSSMEQVVNILQQRNGSSEQMLGTSRQMLSADRIIRRVQEVLQGGDSAQSAADGLSRDAQLYGSVLKGLIEGNPDSGVRPINDANARKILTDMDASWAQLADPVAKLVAAAGNIADVKRAGNQASLDSQTVLLRANDLSEQIGKLPLRRLFPNVWWGLLGAIAAVAFALLLVITLVRDQRRRFAQSTELNQRNQEAIMRLLDEMGSLAEGDLTVKTTVSEDITGAIADSVNYAIDELRSLVTTINETSEQVSSSAQETQTTARHLANAAEQQAQQISTATSAINQIASSMDDVSKNSAESADVAERSVKIASHGAEVVRETISGMDSIRDQIQETSKRIKRLGESSQEIGSIVELINDIAEQTNILALNAAIQAASAGEAGRGFAVVADEVQRLAERSTSATKRIETLVQTIQSDTNEAVNSMEQTTAEVVAGARLAEDAGSALGDIERVSHDLSALIQNISTAAREQSAAATDISVSMNAIQEITSQTSQGASQTADSIGTLAQLASDLRRSVAHFKLPG
ncbi:MULTISPECIES: methyl-accepting chemotaxis protein [Rhodanobacter]|uniref:Methyl-accepting chemotaxis protein n=1 Tax=Rhodanobacter denitrificans TaxID=666685 RepID=I4WZ29_9GAMM|nr:MULTISPECIES: methyl-accepting chemotaxis protein [Rhodanobacter]AGG88026.1 methyl-accepting chemotaxis protein [Rhodanobacter denitrificans]EIM04721.1 pilus biogenesis protein [Rhodanobacter denitrificans]KZC20535.1 chemotaxis protein [Rhodanobacter denitrificans]UJJ51923.1 methyl-accepting chemotaxis protein [Rhodanobacter denitrificans]UJJ59299.1 methyl-accepting chemotaxis protein [Rhodanobacter denitrificans]